MDYGVLLGDDGRPGRMTRDLFIKTKTDVTRYTLGKNVRPITVVRHRLYRTDEKLMMADRCADSEFVLYDLDDIQPYCVEETLSPDDTMAMIDIAKSSGKKSIGVLNQLNQLDSNVFVFALIGIVLAVSFIGGGI